MGANNGVAAVRIAAVSAVRTSEILRMYLAVEPVRMSSEATKQTGKWEGMSRPSMSIAAASGREKRRCC